MQLDRTRIAIRERGLLETLDLALHVTREFAGPIAICALLAILPLALLNYALVGWMMPTDLDEFEYPLRYGWNMVLLIYLEAPLAGIFLVAWLGPAVFMEQRTIRQVLADVFRFSPQLFVSQVLLRGVLVAWLLYVAVDRFEFSVIEGFFVVVAALYATAMRAVRPYINEIILLERNPLFAGKTGAITIGKRSSHLHGPYAGDLVIRWIGAAAVALLLAGLALATIIVVQGTLLGDWPLGWNGYETVPNFDWFKLQILYPACLWLVVTFMAVVRFLSYLDLRIRHEGWEVELLMRAEALRLATRME
jgi:hypothetical protein